MTTYTFDAAGRLTEVLYADGSQDLFAYDAAGNLTAWEGGGVKGAMGYDPLGRKTSETVDYGAFTKGFAYTYDARGNKATYTSPEGTVSKYTHSLGDRLKTIEMDGKVFEFIWDKTRLKQMKLPNGIVTDYAYNQASWLTGIEAAKEGSTFFTRAYGFDHVGNILNQTADHGKHSYGYDDLYQLTSADNPTLPDEAYSYDRVGNRLISADTQGTWNYNRNNELLDSVTATFEYDANGNTVKKTEDGQTTVYVYNARNRLERVLLPDGRMAEYTYDPFGRRVKKSVSGAITYFTYADEGLIGEYDATGALQTAYGWKPDGLWGTDPLYLRQNGTLVFYHNDHLGTPQKMTDQSGAVVWSAVYAAFGAATVDQASTITTNLRFPGQYFDAETGLHYNHQRFYDPTGGRYLQMDPIGFAGNLNVYRYVDNSPIGYVDIFGFKKDLPEIGYTALEAVSVKCHDIVDRNMCHNIVERLVNLLGLLENPSREIQGQSGEF